MIYINCPMKQDFIIDLLENAKEAEFTYKFVEKQGIKLTFDVNTKDVDKAIAEAKKLIKATDFGKVLYFQIVAA